MPACISYFFFSFFRVLCVHVFFLSLSPSRLTHSAGASFMSQFKTELMSWLLIASPLLRCVAVNCLSSLTFAISSAGAPSDVKTRRGECGFGICGRRENGRSFPPLFFQDTLARFPCNCSMLSFTSFQTGVLPIVECQFFSPNAFLFFNRSFSSGSQLKVVESPVDICITVF